MRLDKYLADMNLGTRKEVKSLIKNKLVKVNDEIITKADFNVHEKDTVKVNDEVISYVQYEYILLHKPGNYICANEDKIYPTVFELIESKRKDLFTVGRLDVDTEGLLLITNDGTLAHRLISPKYHVDKKYYAKLKNALIPDAQDILENPMDLGDFITKGAKFEKISSNEAYLTIDEGKYHQVKRMFEKIDNEVVYLKRISFAFLSIDDIEISKWRYLSDDELNNLKKLVGLV